MTETTHTAAVWKQLLRLKTVSPALYALLKYLVILELFVSVVAPVFVPENLYLSYYLHEKSKTATKDFLENKGILVPDDNVGWVNAPNYSRGNWIIDSYGSRGAHPFSKEKQKSTRVLFLGSSLINGGTDVKNDETVSYYIEDSDIEAINFGVMLFKMDQVLLYYVNRLYQFEPDIIVVGLNGTPNLGLKNLYIPFFNRDERNIPFLKPAFTLENGKLTQTKAPLLKLLYSLKEDGKALGFFKEHDDYYVNFELFRRMELTPLLRIVRHLYSRGLALESMFEAPKSYPLLEALMTEFVNSAHQHHAKVLFVLFPTEAMLPNHIVNAFRTDKYGKLIARLKSLELDVVDLRKVFVTSSRPSSDLYIDGFHLSPLGNRLLAKNIRNWIHAQ